MPSITIEWLQNNLGNGNVNKDYPVFVETGTYMGGTVLPLEAHFEQLHTIEIKEEFLAGVCRTYHAHRGQRNQKINFYLGDSSKILAELCPRIRGNTIFFLDGHWSAGDTGKGDKDCPLYEELGCIMSKHEHSSIVIVDDCRLFGMGPNVGNEICNWEDINVDKLLELVGPRLEKSHFAPSELHPKDRLILHLRKK